MSREKPNIPIEESEQTKENRLPTKPIAGIPLDKSEHSEENQCPIHSNVKFTGVSGRAKEMRSPQKSNIKIMSVTVRERIIPKKQNIKIMPVTSQQVKEKITPKIPNVKITSVLSEQSKYKKPLAKPINKIAIKPIINSSTVRLQQANERINPKKPIVNVSSIRSEQIKKGTVKKPNKDIPSQLKMDAKIKRDYIKNCNENGEQNNALSANNRGGTNTTCFNDSTKNFSTSVSTTRSMYYMKDSREGNNFKDVAVNEKLMKNGGLPRIYREDGQRVYRLGERTSGLGGKKELQDFVSLREQCLDTGRLFEDPNFQAVTTSIYYSKLPDQLWPLEWLRPSKIAVNPQLFVDGFSRFDVQQGALGNCWLVAAVANLTLHKSLFYQIVPDDQSFGDKYAGIFHFRFWQYGRWVDVVIDDRLPTYDGKLVFLHSTENNEFWGALLEKAYAKLHGSYEALEGGTTCEAMKDFTGGISEMYNMNEAKLETLYKILVQGYQRRSLMGCSIEADRNIKEAKTALGLIKGHAYSITRVCYVDVQTTRARGKVPLLRVRNPWGNNAEWSGAWSDKSPEWKCITDENKKEIGLTFDEDGEFWISYKDFTSQFTKLEICNLHPDSLDPNEAPTGCNNKWVMNKFEGEWVRGITAGGCANYKDTFSQNPQYTLTLTDPDEDDDEDLCTVIVALMQKNRRSQRSKGLDSLSIGFEIYEKPKSIQDLQQEFFKHNIAVAAFPSFINQREVSCRLKLPPGTYCIIPSTFKPNEEAEFLLRVFTETACTVTENDEEIGIQEIDERVRNTIPEAELTPEDPVKQFFLKIAGEDGEVDWMELKEVLDYVMKKETQGCGFSKDICRSMVAMMDDDGSGKLGFEEFTTLWMDIRKRKAVFRLYDTEDAGHIPAFLLRDALRSSGYTLNNRTLNILVHRYGSRDGFIAFDDFIMCAIRLKTMIDSFHGSADPRSTLTATFTLEDWLRRTVYS